MKTEPKFKVGDIVDVYDKDGNLIYGGVEVCNIFSDTHGNKYAIQHFTSYVAPLRESRLVHAKVPLLTEESKQSTRPKFKIGDVVNVLKRGTDIWFLEVEVHSITADNMYIVYQPVTGYRLGPFKEDQLELIRPFQHPGFISATPDTETLQPPTGNRRYWPLTVPSDSKISEEQFKAFQADLITLYAKHGLEISDDAKRQVGNYTEKIKRVARFESSLLAPYGGGPDMQNLPRKAVLSETTNDPEAWIYDDMLFHTLKDKNNIYDRLKRSMVIIDTISWFFKQDTRRHLIVANRLKAISSQF